jgi:multidrug efflux pump subunit AcrB
VDRQQALLTGLNTQFIGETVKAAINGRKAGDYREGDEEYDVTVRFPKPFRENLTNLESLTLVNLSGTAVPFSAVARLEQGAGLGSITRVDRKRTATVSAEVDGRPGPEVLKDVQKALAGFPMPPGYSINYTGQNEEQEEAQSFLGRAFIIALFLIALVIIAQFNSILQTLIIMSSVILSLTGVFLGLLIFNMSFSIIMTGIGCISLAGVVVNNAIVLIDFINVRRREGAPTEDAIIEAGITRFRPVMLTAITTVLGLMPMAIGINFDFLKWEWIVGGESSQWWGAMAISVISGLSFATLLTLIVVPTLYSLSVSFTNFFLPSAPEQR